MRGPNGLRILSLMVIVYAGCGGQSPGQLDADGGLPTSSDGGSLSSANASSTPTGVLSQTDDAGTPSEGVATGSTGGTGTPAPSGSSSSSSSGSSGSATSPGSSSSGASTGSSRPDLGPLPSAMAGLSWPTAPHTTRQVTATTAEEITAAAATAGTRILAHGATGGDVSVSANDVEIVADGATHLGRLNIERAVARVLVSGGHWGGVTVAIPGEFVPSTVYRPEWMAQDLDFENMTLDSGTESAFEIRGVRIAVVHADVTAGRYSVWCGDTGNFQSEDIIVVDNKLRSAGPEATARFVSVRRSAFVSNQASNTYKHNYRIHGTSDLNYASDNLLVGTGAMFGTMPEDSLGTMWFDDNVFHDSSPDLFNPSTTAIHVVHARRNMAYTDMRAEFFPGPVPAAWDLADNQVAPYTPAPAF